MAASVVRGTWELNAKISIYDGESNGYLFSRDCPIPLWRSVAFMDEAREKRIPVTFRAEGPDAERAIQIIQELLEGPVEVLEEGFIDVF